MARQLRPVLYLFFTSVTNVRLVV